MKRIMYFKSPSDLVKHILQEYAADTVDTTIDNLIKDRHHSPDAYMMAILFLFRKIYHINDVYFPEKLFQKRIKYHWRNFTPLNI